VDVQEIRTPGLLVANDIGNPIRHSVATIYIKHGCSQMENLEKPPYYLVSQAVSTS
jgi:hypothetical protein